jgi:hypothetical protein
MRPPNGEARNEVNPQRRTFEKLTREKCLFWIQIYHTKDVLLFHSHSPKKKPSKIQPEC